MLSLDEIGIAHNLKQSSLKDDYLSLYEHEISRRFTCKFNLLIITKEKIDDVTSVYAKKYPEAEITLASYGCVEKKINTPRNVNYYNYSTLDELIPHVSLLRPNVIIEHCSNRKSHKLELLKKLFFILSNGGLYFIQELHAKFIPSLIDCDGPDILDLINEVSQLKISNSERKKNADVHAVAIAECCESVLIKGKLGVLVKNKTSLKGLRDDQARSMIDSGLLRGNIITLNDNSYEFEHSISSKVVNQKRNHPSKFKIPESFLVRYFDVKCEVGQVAYQDGYLLPDSFRIQIKKSLSNKNIAPLIDDFFCLKNSKKEIRHLPGEYFYLDSEHPGHFGHFTSEVVSRLWAWDEIKRISPDAKVLIGLEQGKSLPSFIEAILSSYGINSNDIVTFHDNVIVDVLYAATPYYVINSHINPLIRDVWNRIGSCTINGISGIVGKKLFIARPENGSGDRRKCLNPERLEKIFRDNGFEFYNPEKHSWQDQVRTFSNANVIAGYAGSGSFNMMFSSGIKKVLMIGSTSYTSSNEHYICAIKGFDLTYFVGDSLIKQENGWSVRAAMSDYHFNYERDEQSLIEILNEI